MDTTVNDIQEGLHQKGLLEKERTYYTHEMNDKTRLQARIEILIHMLIRYNPQVSILWLGTSSRISWDNNGKPMNVIGDSNDAIQDVLKYYDIPHINVMNGIGPFVTLKQKHWFQTIFRYDSCCHPSVTGHDLIGRILYHYFVNIYQAKEYPLYDGSFALNSMISIHSYSHSNSHNSNDNLNVNVSLNNIKLQFAPQEYLTTYLSTNALVISLIHSATREQYEVMSMRKGWSVKADRPGKPEGYLGSDIGDTFGLEIPGKELSLHLLSYKIHIDMLRTYENIGMFQVEIGRKMKFSDVSSSSIISSKTIQTIIVDSQWKHLFSQHDTEEINLCKEDWQNLSEGEYMSLNITIIPAIPETRAVNKVKLFSIVLF